MHNVPKNGVRCGLARIAPRFSVFPKIFYKVFNAAWAAW
jgi:hypothetical protein